MTVYKSVRALERGLVILEAINENAGMRTQEIAEWCDLSRPTTFRLLETLETLGFVQQSKSDGGWQPTLCCNLLSSGFLDKAWVGQIAMPNMVELGAEILWPVDLVTLAVDAMQVRETTHKVSPFSFDVGMVGKKLPMLQTAGGRAYLANCPDEEREEILQIMRKTGKPEHQLAHNEQFLNNILETTRQRGYGYRAEKFKAHTVSISMPICKDNRPIAALTIVCLKSAISLEQTAKKFAEPLRRTCDRIDKQIAQGAK